jgi:hypothetical protein
LQIIVPFDAGEGWQGIAASRRGNEDNWLGIREAHNVDFSPQEDRSGTEGAVGEGEGCEEEGGVGPDRFRFSRQA